MRSSETVAGMQATLCCLLLAALTACSRSPQDSPAPAPDAAVSNADQLRAAAADQTRGMKEGVPVASARMTGKPQAPVELKFEIAGEPAEDEPLAVEIALLPRAGTDLMRVSFIASEGLQLAPSGATAEFHAVQADTVYRHSLTVTPRAEGEYFLSAIVLMNVAGGPQARSFNIRVPVGETAAAATAASKMAAPPVDATGQPIESMRAAPAPPVRED